MVKLFLKNKIIFDKNFHAFSFDDIIVSHENQSMKLNGSLSGAKNKDIALAFNNVNLNKITPTVEQFKFDGFVNGEIYLKQNNSVYQPTATLEINELQINENALGKMNLDIKGNEDFSKFEIDSKSGVYSAPIETCWLTGNTALRPKLLSTLDQSVRT